MVMLRVLVIYPPLGILIFLWCLRLLMVFPSMLNKRTSRFCMGMQHKTRRQNNDDLIHKPTSKPKENSHLGIGTLILLSKLTDEMDPNYILHALPSQHEERSDKWAWATYCHREKGQPD
jgi:hypothetical protein